MSQNTAGGADDVTMGSGSEQSHEIRALLFDLDKTLVSRDKAAVSWLVGFALAYMVDPLAGLDGSGSRSRNPGARRTLARLARDADAALGRCVTLDAAARRLLAALQQGNLPFGIVSNGRRHRRHSVRALGLEDATSCIFISREVGRRKPDRALFLAAAACLGVPARTILFVGDKPRADMEGARAAGMQTAWLRRGRHWPQHKAGARPDLVLDSLDALVEILGL